MPRFLHVGCGHARKNTTVKAFADPAWEEVTLDIDATVRPDIVDKLPELESVGTATFDAVYSAHNLEHLYPHEVPVTLAAFHRVLNANGFVIVTCPDLQAIGEQIASGDIDTPLYVSNAGPVSALDILYGFRPAMARGNLYMAHHTGFTLASIRRAFGESGFGGSVGFRGKHRDLWVMGVKGVRSEQELRDLAKTYLRPA